MFRVGHQLQKNGGMPRPNRRSKEEVGVHVIAHKRNVERYFNKRVQPQSFQFNDLVLKEIGVKTQKEGQQTPKWEGLNTVMVNCRMGYQHSPR